MKSIGVAHQFLSKPCAPELLQKTIERACGLKALINSDAVRQAVSGLNSLPTVPALYRELVQLLQSSDATTDAVAKIIAKDIGMTTRILQLANSAFFGLPRAVSTVDRAVAYLGLDTVGSLVLAQGVFSSYKGAERDGLDVEKTILHGMRTAAVAKAIAKDEGRDKQTVEHAFLAGMLHDVGSLVLAAELPSKYAEAHGADCDTRHRSQGGGARDLRRVTRIRRRVSARPLGPTEPDRRSRRLPRRAWRVRGRRLGRIRHRACRKLHGDSAGLQERRHGSRPRPRLSASCRRARPLARMAGGRRDCLAGRRRGGMTERVLLVDDEPLVLEGLKRQLRKKIEVETAVGGREGLALIERSEPFAVVVSDMRMPEMNGSQFLEQVRKRSPDSVRMILSGQAEIESTIAAVNLGQIFRFLTKPCSTEALIAALDRASSNTGS